MAKKLIDVQANGFKSYVDATAANVGAMPYLTLTGAVDFNSINSGAPCVATVDGTSYTNGPLPGPSMVSGKGGGFTQLTGEAGNITQRWDDIFLDASFHRSYIASLGWTAWTNVWDGYTLPAGTTGKSVLAASTQAAARSAISALPVANPTATGTLTAPDVVVSNLAGTGTRAVAADSTGRLVVSPGSEEMVLSDFGRVGSGGLWQSAFTDNTSASLRLLANSVTNGTHIRIDQEMEVPFDSGAQYQFALGPYLPPGTGPSFPQYVAAIDMSDGKYGQGRLEIEVEFIGSGAGMVAYVTSTQFRRSGSPFQSIVYTGSIPFDATIENWIDIRFNPSSLPGSDYIIRRNRVYRVNP